MSRRLVLVNVVLVVCALGAGGYILLALTEPEPKPLAVRSRFTATPAPAERPATAPTAPPGGAAAYSVVASRNLFSPTRTEVAAATAALRPAAMLPKPNLHGVVLVQGGSIAYLEDPATRRVAAYRLGDSIAGGTVQSINADHVVLSRPDGPVDVRLHDPSKPRPAPPAVPAPPGQFQQPGVPIPPQAPGVPQPPQAGMPQAPFIQQPNPPVPFIPGRRALPPSLLRRVVPSAPSDAPSQ